MTSSTSLNTLTSSDIPVADGELRARRLSERADTAVDNDQQLQANGDSSRLVDRDELNDTRRVLAIYFSTSFIWKANDRILLS
jgi:hypothetical protein